MWRGEGPELLNSAEVGVDQLVQRFRPRRGSRGGLYAGHTRGKRLGGRVGLLTPAILIILGAGNALGNPGASPHQKLGSLAPPKNLGAWPHQEFGGVGPPRPNGQFAVA
jgi:hypothetical protein